MTTTDNAGETPNENAMEIATCDESYTGLPCQIRSLSSANHVVEGDAFSSASSVQSENEEYQGTSRLEECRKRNREHARRTRQRKKAKLEDLQQQVKVLQQEHQNLKQNVEEYSLAAILMGLSGNDDRIKKVVCGPLQDSTALVNTDTTVKQSSNADSVIEGHFCDISEKNGQMTASHPVTLNIDGETVTIGGNHSQINWKTGKCLTIEGKQLTLTPGQLTLLRRERNRMHAKLTRDRKKNFLENAEQLVKELKTKNDKMRKTISTVMTLSEESTSQSRVAITPELSSVSALNSPTSMVPLPNAPKIHGKRTKYIMRKVVLS